MQQQIANQNCSASESCSQYSTPLYLCRCLQITEGNLQFFIESQGLQTLQEVRRHTGAGSGCNSCHYRIKQLLRETEASVLDSEEAPA